MLLTLLSIFRQQLRLGYEAWRLSHTVLGVAALGFAIGHVLLAGRYLATGWKAWPVVAICVAMVGAYAYIRGVRPALMRRAPYKVTEVRPERGRVWSLAVQAEGHPGMRFLPGQYGYLKLGSPYSLDEHPFSFSSSSGQAGRFEFAINEQLAAVLNLMLVAWGNDQALPPDVDFYTPEEVGAARTPELTGAEGLERRPNPWR